MSSENAGHVALITGANHGIGAATARRLAADGIAVLISYVRMDEEPDAGTPETYRRNRAADAVALLEELVDAGGRAIAVEADLTDAETPGMLFDLAEEELGPVDVLVNNASGWLADTFTPDRTDRLGRGLQPVTAATFDRQFAVDARGSALLIAEFARRHIARGGTWGRIVSLTSGDGNGFPQEVSYGAAKAALVNYTLSAAWELASYGVTANALEPPVTDTGWVTEEVVAAVTASANHLHVATPGQVADVIGFLMGDAAGLLTANVLRLR